MIWRYLTLRSLKSNNIKYFKRLLTFAFYNWSILCSVFWKLIYCNMVCLFTYSWSNVISKDKFFRQIRFTLPLVYCNRNKWIWGIHLCHKISTCTHKMETRFYTGFFLPQSHSEVFNTELTSSHLTVSLRRPLAHVWAVEKFPKIWYIHIEKIFQHQIKMSIKKIPNIILR